MGNGTKVALVVVMALVVVFIASVLKRDIERAPGGRDQITGDPALYGGTEGYDGSLRSTEEDTALTDDDWAEGGDESFGAPLGGPEPGGESGGLASAPDEPYPGDVPPAGGWEADPRDGSALAASEELDSRDPGFEPLSSEPRDRLPLAADLDGAGNLSRTEPVTPPPAETPRFPQTHEVQEGDNLWNIAGTYYEDPTLYPLIVKANPDLDSEDELYTGMKLTIPAPPARAVKATARKPGDDTVVDRAEIAGRKPAPAKPGYRAYTIVDGDTFYGIAEELLGDGLRWNEIARANPALRPERLPEGTVIQVPPR